MQGSHHRSRSQSSQRCLVWAFGQRHIVSPPLQPGAKGGGEYPPEVKFWFVARSVGWCGGTGSKASEPGEIPLCFPWRDGSRHEVTCKHGQAEPSGIGWGPFRQMMAPGCIVHASHAVCRLVSSAATVRRPAAVIAEPTALCAQGWTKSEVIFLRSPSLRQRMELMLLALGSGPC